MAEKLDRAATANVRKLYMRQDFPHVYGISLGRYKCTRKCRMCPMFNMPPANPMHITDDIMDRALAPVGDRKLNLEVSAYGEPFTHPRADHYMFLSRKRAPKAEIVFVTNGSVLNKERCEKIVDSGIDILQFSLDAGSPESYKWLTGSNAYEHTCRNLEQLVEIRNQRGAKHLKVQTHIMGIKELEHEFKPFVEKWSKIVDQAVVRSYGNWGGRVDDNSVTPAEATILPEERYPCAWLWYATKIEPNGDVVKCHQHTIGEDGDDEKLGNLLEEDFESIWHGETMKRAREYHLSNQYDKLKHCKDCQVWSLFYDVWKKEKKFGIFPTGRWA
jgi:radical SAM protein with 4Fe4S-binding SPASM domain